VPLRRGRGIHGHVGRARLEDAEERGDPVDGLPEVHADPVPRPHAAREETVADTIGQPHELAVADPSGDGVTASRLLDGDRFGIAPRAGPEDVVERREDHEPSYCLDTTSLAMSARVSMWSAS